MIEPRPGQRAGGLSWAVLFKLALAQDTFSDWPVLSLPSLHAFKLLLLVGPSLSHTPQCSSLLMPSSQHPTCCLSSATRVLSCLSSAPCLQGASGQAASPLCFFICGLLLQGIKCGCASKAAKHTASEKQPAGARTFVISMW
jgi:hypothetical protein